METIAGLADVLNAGGFVAICAVLMWYIKYITDQHKKEVDDLKDVIQKGIITLQRILDELDMKDDLTNVKKDKKED